MSQVDLKPTDSKNELKKKVGKKVGIPFERLKMRLGKEPNRLGEKGAQS